MTIPTKWGQNGGRRAAVAAADADRKERRAKERIACLAPRATLHGALGLACDRRAAKAAASAAANHASYALPPPPPPHAAGAARAAKAAKAARQRHGSCFEWCATHTEDGTQRSTSWAERCAWETLACSACPECPGQPAGAAAAGAAAENTAEA